ncbi:hypothetical protein ACFL09_00535 [Planctomycetota bacterium]
MKTKSPSFWFHKGRRRRCNLDESRDASAANGVFRRLKGALLSAHDVVWGFAVYPDDAAAPKELLKLAEPRNGWAPMRAALRPARPFRQVRAPPITPEWRGARVNGQTESEKTLDIPAPDA